MAGAGDCEGLVRVCVILGGERGSGGGGQM